MTVSSNTAAGQPEIGVPQQQGNSPNPGYAGMMEREYTYNFHPMDAF